MRNLTIIVPSTILAVFLFFSAFAGTHAGRSNAKPSNAGVPQKSPRLNLAGRWQDDALGVLVDVSVSGTSVTAKYRVPQRCKRPTKAGEGNFLTLDTDFRGTLDPEVGTIKGETSVCFYDTKKQVTLG